MHVPSVPVTLLVIRSISQVFVFFVDGDVQEWEVSGTGLLRCVRRGVFSSSITVQEFHSKLTVGDVTEMF